MNIVEFVLVTFFVLWFLVSIIGQLPVSLNRWFRMRDVFALIPQWTFFAPKPGVTDVHLLYRDLSRNGLVGAWREVRQRSPRFWWHCLWNPEKRGKKALVDLGQELSAAAEEETPISVQGSVPYLLALDFVTRQQHAPNTELIQFMVMRSPGQLRQAEAQPVFISARHKL